MVHEDDLAKVEKTIELQINSRIINLIILPIVLSPTMAVFVRWMIMVVSLIFQMLEMFFMSL